jgi:hypothetical protein
MQIVSPFFVVRYFSDGRKKITFRQKNTTYFANGLINLVNQLTINATACMNSKPLMLICILFAVFFSLNLNAQNLGIFDSQRDVGHVKLPGSTIMNPDHSNIK